MTAGRRPQRKRHRQTTDSAVSGRPEGTAARLTHMGNGPPGLRRRSVLRLHTLTLREAPPFVRLGMPVAASCFPATMGGFVWDDVVITEDPAIREASVCGESGFRRLTSTEKSTTGQSCTRASVSDTSYGGKIRPATTL